MYSGLRFTISYLSADDLKLSAAVSLAIASSGDLTVWVDETAKATSDVGGIKGLDEEALAEGSQLIVFKPLGGSLVFTLITPSGVINSTHDLPGLKCYASDDTDEDEFTWADGKTEVNILGTVTAQVIPWFKPWDNPHCYGPLYSVYNCSV